MGVWWAKAAVHKVLARIPGGHRINEIFQTHLTRSLDLTDERFHNKLDGCWRHWTHFTTYSGGTTPRTAFELGAGWYPVTPLGMFLLGVDRVWTCDIAPLLRPHRVREAMRRIISYHQSGKLASYWPNIREDRMARLIAVAENPSLKTTEELLTPLGITVLVCDAQKLPFEAGSIDLISTYGVLMHIPIPILKNVLTEYRRIGSASAVQSHWIDLTDLYHWGDRSLSPLNFLRFSDRTWQWLQNPMTPMNRMRVSDYRKMFAETGFEVVEEKYRTGEPGLLDRLPLAPEFQSYPREELLILDVWMTARPVNPTRNPDPVARPA